METLTKNKLKQILRDHTKWLRTNKCEGKCAEFKEIVLTRIDLSGAVLDYAIFDNCDLSDACLSPASMVHTNFNACRMHHTNLASSRCDYSLFTYAHIIDVNGLNASFQGVRFAYTTINATSFHKSNFEHAMFDDTIINNSCIINSNLNLATFKNCAIYGTDLIYSLFVQTKFRKVSITKCEMYASIMTDADIDNDVTFDCTMFGKSVILSDLSKAKFINCRMQHSSLTSNATWLPSEERCRIGKILSKKIRGYKVLSGNLIATLEIPKGNIVFSINNNKCRTQSAKVIKIEDRCGNQLKYGHSMHNYAFKYVVGKTVVAKDFNLQYNVECGGGIHFFRTKTEALAF